METNVNDDEIIKFSDEGVEKQIILHKMIIREIELRFKGYESTGDGNKFVPTGNVLLGSKLIQEGISLLQSYAAPSNLIAIKDFKDLALQKWRIRTEFNQRCYSSEECPKETQSLVMEAFIDVTQNLGDIIKSSRSYIEQISANTSQKDFDPFKEDNKPEEIKVN